MRKPWFEAASAAGPSVAGWLVQLTCISVQGAAIRSAWSVRPVREEAEYRRSVAEETAQPCGIAGSEAERRARARRRRGRRSRDRGLRRGRVDGDGTAGGGGVGVAGGVGG